MKVIGDAPAELRLGYESPWLPLADGGCMARPDYIVDIAGVETAGSLGVDGAKAQPAAAGVQGGGRPWLAILWRCCSVYGRAYRNAGGTAYEARCPRCGKAVVVRIGTGGTNCRFFEAG